MCFEESAKNTCSWITYGGSMMKPGFLAWELGKIGLPLVVMGSDVFSWRPCKDSEKITSYFIFIYLFFCLFYLRNTKCRLTNFVRPKSSREFVFVFVCSSFFVCFVLLHLVIFQKPKWTKVKYQRVDVPFV